MLYLFHEKKIDCVIKKPGVTFFLTMTSSSLSGKTPTTSLFAFNVLRSFAFSEPIIFLSFVMVVWIQVSLFCFEVADLQRLSDCCRGFDTKAVLEAWSIYC